MDLKDCVLWHKLSSKACLKDRDEDAVLCQGCKRLHADLDHQRRKSDEVSPTKCAKRLLPSSNFKLKHLSPKNVAK